MSFGGFGLKEVPGVELRLIWSRNSATAKSAARDFGIQDVASEWRQIAESPDVDADVVVEAEDQELSGRPAYFDSGYLETVRNGLSSVPEVDGVAPKAHEVVPVLAPSTRLSEPRVHILGLAEEWMSGFDRLVDKEGNSLSLSALGLGQVYVSEEVADKLEVSSGDTLHMFLGTEPSTVEVVGVYEKGAKTVNGQPSVVMPLERLQALTNNEGRIASVLISTRGDTVESAKNTSAVLSGLEPLLEGSGLEARPVKQDALEEAEEVGSMFSTIFLIFGQFSVAAGILLIFLIFVMLAAERKRELGIARAVGALRAHVVRMFTFEGAIYALMAAAVGSLMGLVVGWGMVRILALAIAEDDLQLVFAFSWRSLVIAYTLGMVLTFAVVLVSPWRASRLNIVGAIRDIPEAALGRKSLKGLILSVLVLVAGVILGVTGYQGQQAIGFMMGVSLGIIGSALLARRFFLSDRVAFTSAGLGLVAWWILPPDVMHSIVPEMEEGMEMFFLGGIMLVFGAVWAVTYNGDLLLMPIVRLFGRIQGLSPMLRTAVSYPMQSRLRTGMAMAMFSLVVFALIVMSFIIDSNARVFEDTERLSGGYHIQADTSYANPIHDIRAAMGEVDGMSLDDLEATGSFTWAEVEVKQEGSDREPDQRWIRGLDAGYTDSVTYRFKMRAQGYRSDRDVWQALQIEPGTVVVSVGLVPAKSNYAIGDSTPDFQLEGFWLEDETVPEVYIEAQDPRTGNQLRLRVIGVFEEAAFFSSSVMASQETLNNLLQQVVPPRTFVFRLKEGVEADSTAKALEAHFPENGMQAVDLGEEIRKMAKTNRVIMSLLQGFMGLGLVVGIAALVVIAARSVVERRQQIGVLRALGFQKEMVHLTFLLESSFVALLGIGIGIGLGFAMSFNIFELMSRDIDGLTYHFPWLNALVVLIVAYGASLLTTYLPARQAARVYPAEALRSE